jgi:DNA polymerase-3 subunit alpha
LAAAIKGVGEAAVESILSARATAGIQLFRRHARTRGLARVSRKVLEALIKSGACDCFGETRATLFASIDRVMGALPALPRQSARPGSLFGMLEEKAETKDDGLIAWPSGRRANCSRTKRNCSASTSPAIRSRLTRRCWRNTRCRTRKLLPRSAGAR